MIHRSGHLVAFLAFAACNVADPAAHEASLVASPVARGFGVDHYIAAADAVRIFDAHGAELGQLEVSAPTADTRLVDVRLVEGYASNELSRPVDDVFRIQLAADSVFTAVQIDPALAPFFIAHQIELTERTATDPRGRSLALNPSEYATCLPANTNAGCYDLYDQPDYYCVYNDYWSIIQYASTYPSSYGYESACHWECQLSYGLDSYEFRGNECWCLGGTYYSLYQNSVSCPGYPASAQGQCTGGLRDLVTRTKWCAEPGSCSQSSVFAGCTSL